MHNGEQPLFPPIEEVISAYEANLAAEHRRVLSFALVSSIPKMKKWILEYSVTYQNQLGEQVQEAVFGKIYSDPVIGAASYRLMRYLWVNGMNDDSEYTIVRPIAYLSSWNMLLMSKAPGKPVEDWLFEANEGVQAAVQVAVWLTRLHTVPLMRSNLPKRSRAEADLTRFVNELSIAVPAKEASFKTLADRLLHHPVMSWTGPPAMLHGDFHINNVFWDGIRVTAIDFDHHFTGELAWDVAYHACQIQLSAFFKKGDFHYFKHAVKTFIDTYLTRIPEPEHHSFLQRLSLYRSRSLLESLHYELCVCRAGTFDIVDPFLQECELSLQGKGFQ